MTDLCDRCHEVSDDTTVFDFGCPCGPLTLCAYCAHVHLDEIREQVEW